MAGGGVLLVKRTTVDNPPAGKVRIFVDGSGHLSAKDENGVVVTPQTLITSLESLVATKQDASTAATDAELASAVATLTTAINAKQDSSTAATDAELASAIGTVNASIAAEETARKAADATEKGAREAADTTLTTATAAAKATADAALPKAGGTMTGDIVLKGDPTANLHPATKQFVAAQIAALINSAPGALDTLKEIADQLGVDESAVSALTATVAGKLGAAANLSDLVNAATARTNLGLGTAATHAHGDYDASGAAAAAQAASQPLDEDLTKIAALATTIFGRAFLALADAAAARTALEVSSSSESAAAVAAEEARAKAAEAGKASTSEVAEVKPSGSNSHLDTTVDSSKEVDTKVGVETTRAKVSERDRLGATSRLIVPSAFPVFKNTAETATETVPLISENYQRIFALNSLQLVSGTPVGGVHPVQAGQVINGICWANFNVEPTPANRTHLWVALLNSAREVVARSADYTSSTNTPLTNNLLRGLKLSSPYTVGEADSFVYPVICEVMSSTEPIAITCREGLGFINGATPMTAFSAPAGQTTPASFTGTVTLTQAAKCPWLGLF